MEFRKQFPHYIPSVWIWLGIIACITLSALFAGLNLAIFSLSQLRLQIEADGGNKDAARVLKAAEQFQSGARYCYLG
jgi:CBS domain containing-hemolysin-like protein